VLLRFAEVTVRRRTLGLSAGIFLAATAASVSSQTPSARDVALKASDGVVLKATFFAAARPGPGALLLHQSNRDRRSWDEVARQLAAAGIHTLTIDMRGHGESAGPPSDREPDDVDVAFQYLVSQPAVERDIIGVGGAGWLGVLHSVEAARRHPAEVKSLALLSGETLRDGLEFLRQSPRLPELFVVSDADEYPPTVEAMGLLYLAASSPSKKLVHYAAAEEAPWLWYETSDAGKVPAAGGHGTDLFEAHPELPGLIVHWFVTTLIRTPGHAPPDTLACARTLDEIQAPGGAARVARRLAEARRRDPGAQLFPEIAASIIGQDYVRAKDPKRAVEVLELVLLAYPESADAHETLAEAYLADGQKARAREHAEKALALLDAHTVPASSWSDSEPRRGEVRHDAQDVLAKATARP